MVHGPTVIDIDIRTDMVDVGAGSIEQGNEQGASFSAFGDSTGYCGFLPSTK